MTLIKPREDVDKLFVEFAQKHSEIEAICEAGDLEDDFPVFYILIPGYRFNAAFEDEISGLVLKIFHETKLNIESMAFPSPYDLFRENIGDIRVVYRQENAI